MAAIDHFPPTDPHLPEEFDKGAEGQEWVRRHIMEVYAKHLVPYFRKHSLARYFDEEPRDVVNGFFIDRLHKPEWIKTGLERKRQGKFFRWWLTKGFTYYLQEQAREKFNALDQRSQAELRDIFDRLKEGRQTPEEDAAQREFNRSVIVDRVRQALGVAESRCRDEGLATHWQVFMLHVQDGLPYSEVHARLGIGEGNKGAKMVETAKARFLDALATVLKLEGIEPSHAKEELRSMLEDL